jgi:hypothetical protein
MATLNVTNLKNITAGVTNVSLLTDGTTTLVLNATGVNRTGGIRYNAGTLELYNGTAWVAAGGGSGTVTAVTASLPLASSGGAAPNLTLNLGLGAALNGSNIAVSIPVASVPPAAGTGAAQATNGSLYWDDNLTQLFIRYNNGGSPVWVAAAPAAQGGPAAASLAQAATGTLNTVYSSPQTSVPKDASGMTGAALLPTGTLAQRPVTPVAGMTRVSSTTNTVETYANGAWQTVQSTSSGQFAGFRNILINGNFNVNQRGYVSGTAVGAANTYTLDRWKVLVSGQSLTYVTLGNGRQITAPAGGVQQVIENLNINGGTYTLSWVGTATAQVNGVAVANGAQVTLPSNTQVTVTFFSGTVSQAQLEPGYVATPFEQRLVGTEILLCQRYYQESAYTIGGSQIYAGQRIYSTFSTLQQLRATPVATVTLTGTTGAMNGGPSIAASATDIILSTVAFNALNTDGTAKGAISLDAEL